MIQITFTVDAQMSHQMLMLINVPRIYCGFSHQGLLCERRSQGVAPVASSSASSLEGLGGFGSVSGWADKAFGQGLSSITKGAHTFSLARPAHSACPLSTLGQGLADRGITKSARIIQGSPAEDWILAKTCLRKHHPMNMGNEMTGLCRAPKSAQHTLCADILACIQQFEICIP